MVSLQIERGLLDSLSLHNHITSDDPPTLVIYGDQEYPFISEPSEAIHADYEKLGLESKLVIFPGVGHEFRGENGYNAEYGRRANGEMVEWFKAHLLGK